jgi:hypothetical protein
MTVLLLQHAAISSSRPLLGVVEGSVETLVVWTRRLTVALAYTVLLQLILLLVLLLVLLLLVPLPLLVLLLLIQLLVVLAKTAGV